jgi:hemolysin activation/secretion protein
MVNPFQLTLGGRSAVRGFREEHLPGSQRVLVTLEDRVFLGWPAPDLMDMGLTFFADAGKVWAGDVAYGMDSGWRGTVGFGLRFGFPAGSRGVGRVDLAFPLGEGGGGPVFRVTAFELTGILTGFEDPQMRRSRRMDVGPDHFVTQRR